MKIKKKKVKAILFQKTNWRNYAWNDMNMSPGMKPKERNRLLINSGKNNISRINDVKAENMSDRWAK